MNNYIIGKYLRSYLLCIAAICLSFPLFSQNLGKRVDTLMQVVKNSRSDSDKVKALLTLSNILACRDSLLKSEYALDALTLSRKMLWYDGIIKSSFSLGFINSICFHNNVVAIKYYEVADSAAKVSEDKFNQANAKFSVAAQYARMSEYGKAVEYYRKGLALKTGPDLDISALANMGVIYNSLGDLPNALACYDGSLKELDQYIRTSGKSDINDSLQEGEILNVIGDIYRGMKQYDKAFANYQQALTLAAQLKDKWLRMQSLIGLATAYKFKDDFANAIDYYNRALEAGKGLHEVKSEVQIQNYLANVYLEKGDLPNALKYSLQALKLAIENKCTDRIPLAYSTLGAIYTQQKDYNKATTYLQKAIALSKEAGALDIEKQALEAISHTYEASHQPALALEAYRQFITLRDSIYNIDKANELTRIDLQTGYERSKIADSIAAANKVEVAQLRTQKQRVYTYAGFAGLAAVLMLSLVVYRNYSQEKNANRVITKANKIISEQKQVSETLLLNILPADVADELKEKGKVKAKLYENVTVMFTDFVNFTATGERLSPEELVEELHNCFEAFDEIMGRYKIEKIKTIGDGYVAVSGLPNANPHHASDMVKAAIDIRDFIAERRGRLGDSTFDVRIGLNSGKLVAGIVGVKKFAYDIWGDAVNIAARMEQTGLQGKINISHETYQLVKNEFTCTYRGEIEAKNKGMMKMYFVEARI